MAKEEVKQSWHDPSGAKAPEHKGANEKEALNIGQPAITMKEAPEKTTEMGKSIREHVAGIMKKHEPADPNLPSPTEITVRALSLRCLQLLAEVEAMAAQIELYEVPKADDERRAEAKKAEAAAKAHQEKKEKQPA